MVSSEELDTSYAAIHRSLMRLFEQADMDPLYVQLRRFYSANLICSSQCASQNAFLSETAIP